MPSGLVKRGVPLKGRAYGEIVPSAGSTVKQEITLQQGIPIEKAREIVKTIKDTKLKVQASIQGDFARVAGKDRDTLAAGDRGARGRGLRDRLAVHQLPLELGAEPRAPFPAYFETGEENRGAMPPALVAAAVALVKRDLPLRQVIEALDGADFGIDMQFIKYRSN